VPRSTAAPTATYDFTYVGTGSTNEPDYSAQGSGSFTVLTGGGGMLSLADVTAFNLLLDVTTTGSTAYSGPGTDPITYDLAGLVGFAATIGAGGTLSSLSLGTGAGANGNYYDSHVDGGRFEVTGLAAGGATTDDPNEGGVLTQGSIGVTALGPVLSELVVACFAEGTRIRTVSGDVAVEDLRVGDMVATASGGRRRVAWLGHRRIACRRHKRPQDVQPVRIRAHAFGPRRPHRDLWLSPDHAISAAGVLIPVRYLVNGVTVQRAEVATITYWHVELDRHDVLLADGLPCESYLDTGNRGAFVEGGRARILPADFARAVWAGAVWETRACAPLALAGAKVEAVRRLLFGRAMALGHAMTGDPDLHLLADGRPIRPHSCTNATYRFVLPARARRLCLRSRASVPAETSPAGRDHRRLGVAVAALSADRAPVPLDDTRLAAGWYAPEGAPEGASDWRWTNGAGRLALPGTRELAVTLAMTERYWITPTRQG
jgi:hypothetical protein